jgi:tRNA threonylcarbamoyladenosine biosynthesis protein TsaE
VRVCDKISGSLCWICVAERRNQSQVCLGGDSVTIITNNETETEQVGAEFAKKLSSGTVVAMYGGLGVGKTAFVRGMAKGLGLDCRVSSPTFTIVNEYEGKKGALSLFHFDMYRLHDSAELFDIGWEDYLSRDGICVVEWSETVEDAFDGSETVVRITRLDSDRREITMEGVE